jgi:hypothetical protein
MKSAGEMLNKRDQQEKPPYPPEPESEFSSRKKAQDAQNEILTRNSLPRFLPSCLRSPVSGLLSQLHIRLSLLTTKRYRAGVPVSSFSFQVFLMPQM